MNGPLPGHDQYELLVARGFGDSFGGLWVERGDLDEVADLLRLDLGSRRDQVLGEAVAAMIDPPDMLNENPAVWIGPCGPGWSMVIGAYEPYNSAPRLNVVKGRRLLVRWFWEVDGLYDLDFYRDGELVEELPAFPSGELDPGPELEPYCFGLPREGVEEGGWERLAHAFLTIAGRMSGRFIDEDWFRIPGRTYDQPISEADA
ncbi:hypothetical protein [Herbidospora cretacea]|uniref:hypothetical protein n=1 Tax=Herbidospora cretacea TaxID=28444 RepID=UPI0004C42C43|nr:hypothetical protein [Herbidospora cretacea]